MMAGVPCRGATLFDVITHPIRGAGSLLVCASELLQRVPLSFADSAWTMKAARTLERRRLTRSPRDRVCTFPGPTPSS
jgi:hypothetical protein